MYLMVIISPQLRGKVQVVRFISTRRLMKVLVGIPVFRVANLVARCLRSVENTPADILAIDNAADRDVEDVLYDFDVNVIVNKVNGFCNGAWNQILEYGIDKNYDLIGLGSSDAALHPGWYEAITQRAASFPKEIVLPSIGEPVSAPDWTLAEHPTGGVPGYFSFLPLEAARAVFPIPRGLKHWFGDQYMFEKLRALGWKIAILKEVRAYHCQSAITVNTPEAYQVIEQDIKTWNTK